MRWNRSHRSSNLEDRRAMGPALGGLGGGGMNVVGLIGLLGRFGWKGILIGIVLVGALMYGGGQCSGWDPLESTCRHASLSIL